MRAVWIAAVSLTLAGCGGIIYDPPTNRFDPPAIEFRNEAGMQRFCNDPNLPGLVSGPNYRGCRDRLVAEGFREIGPWCGNAAAFAADDGTDIAIGAVTGGVIGAVQAGNLTSVRRAHAEECRRRAAGA